MTPTRPATVSLTANEPGAAISKFLIASFLARGNMHRAADIAAERCRTTPIVEHEFRRLIAKGAVGGMALSDAEPLGLGGEAFRLLQSMAIFGRLMPRCRRMPARVVVPKDVSDSGTGAWRAEGAAAPLSKHVTGTLTMDPSVADYIVAVSQELLRFGQVAEAALRQMVFAGLAKWIDTQLLDPSVAAAVNHPASLTYGTPTITSAGTTAANIITDVDALLAAATTPLDEAVIVCQTRSYLRMCAKLAGAGYPVERGYLCGIPVITGSTSPRQLALIDCGNVAYTSDDAIGIELSTEAVLQMADNPTMSGVTGTGAAAVSLWQTGLAAVKAELHASWQHVHFNPGSPTVPAGVATVAITY